MVESRIRNTILNHTHSVSQITPISLRFILILYFHFHLDLLRDILRVSLALNNLKLLLPFIIGVTCPAYPTLLDLITYTLQTSKPRVKRKLRITGR